MQTMEHTMSKKQQLIEAKALITPREHWGQGDFAQDADGGDVSTLSETAKCFCALGAYAHVAKINVNSADADAIPNSIILLLDHAADRLYSEKTGCDANSVSIVELNDHEVSIPDMHPHDAVLAAYDIAIEMAGVEETAL
jgi:mannose/cellobiose epimerase-like protein (N-acyl-D-glucosamine 2-epimerase family)